VCVPEEWPPGELEDGLAEEGAHPDHEEDVEDGRANDSPDPDICVEKMQCEKSLQMRFIKRFFTRSRSTTHAAFMMQLRIDAEGFGNVFFQYSELMSKCQNGAKIYVNRP
jgi:hypothetical protein